MKESHSLRQKTVKRHNELLGLLDKQIRDVGDLAESLQVSESTVRRDLARLEESGAIARTYGGAIPRLEESSFTVSLGKALREKEQIADLAYTFIEKGSSIFLDAGTTCLALAHRLIGSGVSQVITRSLEAALVLSRDSNIDVIITGGRMMKSSHGLVGNPSSFLLERSYFDVGFFGADLIDPQRGLGEPSFEEIFVKESAAKVSGKCILLADNSKFEPKTVPAWMWLKGNWTIVTDSKTDRATLEQWQATDIRIIQAPAGRE